MYCKLDCNSLLWKAGINLMRFNDRKSKIKIENRNFSVNQKIENRKSKVENRESKIENRESKIENRMEF